ncbi:unnamed protein product, partial [marine sediment metagenome]
IEVGHSQTLREEKISRQQYNAESITASSG